MPIGNHVSKDGSPMHVAILDSIARAKKCGIDMKCLQIFTVGPRGAKETLSAAEKAGVREAIVKNNMKLYVHGSYLDNPWGSKPQFAKVLIKRELAICEEIGAQGLVVHLAKKDAKTIAEALPSMLATTKTARIFLEVECHKASDDTYESAEKLANLFEEVGKLEECAGRVGLCIDTAHLWAAGKDISGKKEMSDFLAAIDKIPNVAEVIVHLNDQIWEKGSGRDEHAPLGYGMIWGCYNGSGAGKEESTLEDSGLAALLEWAQKGEISLILERKPDRPKINSRPIISNIESDYNVVAGLGYYKA